MIRPTVADQVIWENVDPATRNAIKRLIYSRLYDSMTYVGELHRLGEMKHFYEISGDSKEEIIEEILK